MQAKPLAYRAAARDRCQRADQSSREDLGQRHAVQHQAVQRRARFEARQRTREEAERQAREETARAEWDRVLAASDGGAGVSVLPSAPQVPEVKYYKGGQSAPGGGRAPKGGRLFNGASMHMRRRCAQGPCWVCTVVCLRCG